MRGGVVCRPTWHPRDQHVLLCPSGDAKQHFYFKSRASEGNLAMRPRAGGGGQARWAGSVLAGNPVCAHTASCRAVISCCFIGLGARWALIRARKATSKPAIQKAWLFVSNILECFRRWGLLPAGRKVGARPS